MADYYSLIAGAVSRLAWVKSIAAELRVAEPLHVLKRQPAPGAPMMRHGAADLER